MTDKKFDFDTEKLVQPNNKADVKQFKADLETIAKGSLDIAKGTSSLIVGIVKSKIITISLMNRVKGADNYANKHINTITKMFVRDMLSVTDWNSFDKDKKTGIKKAMKIAMAVILQGSLSKDDNEKSFTKNGSVLIDTAKFSTKTKQALVKAKIFNQDDMNITGTKIMTIKSLSSMAEIELGLKSNPVGSDLKIAFNNAFNLISNENKYNNDFNSFPADCRLLWSEWSRKLNAIESHFNSIQDVSKLYAKK